PAGAGAGGFRRVGGILGVLAMAILVVFLVQQIPPFAPDPAVRKTPLDSPAVDAVMGAILALMVLAVRLALRPDRDPLGPTRQGRPGYIYLAEVLPVLLFLPLPLHV